MQIMQNALAYLNKPHYDVDAIPRHQFPTTLNDNGNALVKNSQNWMAKKILSVLTFAQP